jgi:L,D-transpeptidase catalytic domain
VIPVWEHPKRKHAAFRLVTRNPSGSTSPMLIEGAKRRAGEAWYRVLLPLRPNGSAAWVRESDVSLRRIDQRIEVDLSDRTLRYYVHDELKKHFRVGVGTDATPTGTGTFYVWVKVRYASPYQPYGLLAGALGVAGRRPDGDPRDLEPERPRQRRVARLRSRVQRRSEVAARRAARHAGPDHQVAPSFPVHLRKVEERSNRRRPPWHRRTRRRT